MTVSRAAFAVSAVAVLGATTLIMSGLTANAAPKAKKASLLPAGIRQELENATRDVRGLATSDPRLTVIFSSVTWGRLSKPQRIALCRHMPVIVKLARSEPFRYLGTSGDVLMSHVVAIRGLRDGQWELVLETDSGTVDAVLGKPIVDYKTIVCGNDVSYCHGTKLSAFTF